MHGSFACVLGFLLVPILALSKVSIMKDRDLKAKTPKDSVQFCEKQDWSEFRSGEDKHEYESQLRLFEQNAVCMSKQIHTDALRLGTS